MGKLRHPSSFSMRQYDHCTVWQHSWYCPLCGLIFFFFILAVLRLIHTLLSCNIIHLCSDTLCTAVLGCNSLLWHLSCSISRRTQLFLKLEDFFWREHLSKLALPYGIKGSGMLILHYPLLCLLSSLSTCCFMKMYVLWLLFTYMATPDNLISDALLSCRHNFIVDYVCNEEIRFMTCGIFSSQCSLNNAQQSFMWIELLYLGYSNNHTFSTAPFLAFPPRAAATESSCRNCKLSGASQHWKVSAL